MTFIDQNLASAGKNGASFMLSVANIGIESAKSFTDLNLQTSRAVLKDGVDNVKALMVEKNPQEQVKLQSKLVPPFLDNALAYGRGVYEIALKSQEEIAREFGSFFTQAINSTNTTIHKQGPQKK